MISLTPNAAQKIRSLAQDKPGGFMRLKVVAGGCSGMSYSFEFTQAAEPGDIISELDGAKLAVDPNSDLFVNGSVLDYTESLMQSGFEVKNPKAVSTCSCGTSFNTADEETFAV